MLQQPLSFDEFYNSIWYKIPEVWRNSDSAVGRPLQILTLTMAQQMYYYFYLKISALDELFDPDLCPSEYLAFLSSLVGWKLIGQDPISWRQQIKAAPLLYKIKGTEKSIILAEKLIGYSVFMTELYRDYTGNIVPKEKLFNTFPVRVKIKPWFRKSSLDTEKHIFTDAFSDLFPSFNENSGDIDNLGNLIHPKKLRRISTKYAILSSISGYNSKTGANSLARLAKLPRINIILKKDSDLDSVSASGVSLDATTSDALDLFLKFKPFHIYINNLVVMYNLTDYLFGTKENPSNTDGSNPGDAILFREELSMVGGVDISGPTERISYKLALDTTIIDPPSSGQDISTNKGNVLIKYQTLNLHSPTPDQYVVDIKYLQSLGMSLKGYTMARELGKYNKLWTLTDFVLSASVDPSLLNRDPLLPTTTLIDNINYKYSPFDFTPPIEYSFLSIPFKSTLTHLHNFIPLTIKNISSDPTAEFLSLTPIISSNFLHDTAKILYTTYTIDPLSTLPFPNNKILTTHEIDQDITTGDAWSFDGLVKVYTKFPSIYKLSSNGYITTISSLLEELYTSGFLVIAEWNGNSFIVQDSDIKLDSKNECLVLNMYNIITRLESQFSLPQNSESYYYDSLLFNILYVEKTPITETFNNDTTITRGTNISSRRKHKKFTRYEFLDTSTIDALRQTQSIDTQFVLDATGKIQESYDYTRGFNTLLPTLFTRKTLFEETRNNSTVLSINSREPRNEVLWTVLNPSPASYMGAYPVITDFWANYYNVPISADPLATVSYKTIDTSAEVQIENRNSDRWKALISKVSPVQKEYFLLSRNNDYTRISKWTRGSALKSSLPFIGASRAHVQPFRSDLTLFNRIDNLSDYAASSVSKYVTLGNYEYSNFNTDMTSVFFSIGGTTTSVIPITNEFSYILDATKATISSTGLIDYPLSSLNISTYDQSFTSLHRDKYYSSTISNIPSFSMYAGNIRFDTSAISGDLFNTLFDAIDISIGGLVKQSLTYTGLQVASLIIPLDYNTYIVWRELNTAATVNIGLAPDVSYTLVSPNIRLLHNGIDISAGVNWTISDNPLQLNLSSSLVINDTDVFQLDYETLGAAIINDPRLVQIPHSGLTHYAPEITNITSVDRNYLKVIHFANDPLIQWNYGGPYSGWSRASNNLTNILPPEPLINTLTAIPDITVTYNSTVLIYKVDWNFRAIPDTISYRIQLEQHISDLLQPTDQIKVDYYS